MAEFFDMKVIIRKVHSTDFKKLSILYKQVYIKTYGKEGVSDEFANYLTEQFSLEKIKQNILTNTDCLLVAEYKGNLVGVLEIAYNSECAIQNIVAPEIKRLYILEWFCDKGIGKLLLCEAENILLEKGLDKIWLWVLDTNQRAISFYKKHKYFPIGEAPFKMEINTYNNIVMLKNL